jgi:hypothetical protein
MTKVPLVGMFFHPPANLVLKGLLGGTHLTLLAEPENPYDANAIRVECCPRDMEPEYAENARDELEGFGYTLEELLEIPSIHLGYVAKNATHLVRGHFEGYFPCGGVLVWSGDGKPWIELDDPYLGEDEDE